MYEAVTRGIAVRVRPRFLPAESSSDDSRYFWAYTVEIENRGSETVQLRTRYWHITDSLGRVEIVRGAGVVGETPVIRPRGQLYLHLGLPFEHAFGYHDGPLRHGHQ